VKRLASSLDKAITTNEARRAKFGDDPKKYDPKPGEGEGDVVVEPELMG
jgi:hypothetical protein